MDYKARFYSPVLNRFIQPDTIIPETYNPQSWNRYSYVKNRPINFNDPTGNKEEPPPWWNPFTYDTWFISARGALKYYVGIEGDVTLYVDMKPLRDKGITGFSEMKGTVNFEAAISLGLSKKLKGGVVVGSTEGNLSDQTGIDVAGLDGEFSTNLSGCTKLMCGGLETTYNANKDYLTSKGVLFGVGAGYDLSLNLVEISDSFLVMDKNTFDLRVPFVNESFRNKAYTTISKIRTQLNKLLPE